MAEVEKTSTTTVATDHKRPRATLLHHYHHHRRSILHLLITLLLVAGITALILYLVYRPSKPRFTLTSLSLLSLDPATSLPAPALSVSIQLTLVARNPNDRATILYDNLVAYVVYRNHPITPVVRLPPLVQGKESAVAVSPVFGGVVPVGAEVVEGLRAEEGYGVVRVRVVVRGRVKYRISGGFRSGWVGLYVRCDVMAGVSNGVRGEVPVIGDPECDVDA